MKSTVTTRKKVGFTKFLLKCKKFPNHATISQGRFGETSVKSTYFAELRLNNFTKFFVRESKMLIYPHCTVQRWLKITLVNLCICKNCNKKKITWFNFTKKSWSMTNGKKSKSKLGDDIFLSDDNSFFIKFQNSCFISFEQRVP